MILLIVDTVTTPNSRTVDLPIERHLDDVLVNSSEPVLYGGRAVSLGDPG